VPNPQSLSRSSNRTRCSTMAQVTSRR
jgi:hypothetical protein